MEIRNFSDYRSFLKLRIGQLRAENQKYSMIFFSREIGASDTYIKQVCSGRRRLTIDKARALGQKLRLSKDEVFYFLTLVMLDQIKEKETQEYFKEILRRLKKSYSLSYDSEEKIPIFRDNLTWEIYTMAGLKGFRSSAHWIQKKIRIRSNLSDIRKSLKTIDQFKEKNDGKTKNIILKDSKQIETMYRSTNRRANQYLAEGHKSVDDRFESFCVLLSRRQRLEVGELVDKFKRDLVELVNQPCSKTQVSYLNLQFFDLTD